MGIPDISKTQMRLRWTVIQLALFLLIPIDAQAKGHAASPTFSSAVPIPAMRMTEENSTAVGQCGIVLPETFATQKVEQNRHRQLCFALQNYGFLTRYVRHKQEKTSSWGGDCCLLLVFCGHDCHRLYGHPQQTPAATNVISEVAALLAGKTVNQQPLNGGTGFSSQSKVTAHQGSDTVEQEGELPQHSLIVSKVDTAKRGEVPLSPSNGSPEQTVVSKTHLRDKHQRQGHCRRHFMSHTTRANCIGVYSIEFEAQNQSFGRFFARLALLLGAADIEAVVDIERELQQYIRAKELRALRGPALASSRQPGRTMTASANSSLLLPQQSSEAPKEKPTSSSFSAHTLNNDLRIVLEPLRSDESQVGGTDNVHFGTSAQTIQISIPSNFRARVASDGASGMSVAHPRRLRGGSSRGRISSPTGDSRKAGAASAPINSAAYCKAVSAFMSQKAELQWLQEHIFFLPHRP
ncbi:hypothetical protein, conserved [Eimeria tenella]|uniref:Uncharacterized protein n=1 Tax=Eimeria tenella TaxID=5802 RepID=U6KXB4_EIMTE|nr:hypothetical protein, conserved [Eimeria tenella]CDJ42802.1 hypothetical protein, conserved [Eimeria tenella]|eukprot:XP_013233552.1 hypothetical protein, conserved [Eimeria tenella]